MRLLGPLPYVLLGPLRYVLLAVATVAGLWLPERPAPGTLSKRELEVLRLVADGASNREAAAKLFSTEASIKTHLLHVYDKLGVHDRAAAVGEAYRRGLLS